MRIIMATVACFCLLGLSGARVSADEITTTVEQKTVTTPAISPPEGQVVSDVHETIFSSSTSPQSSSSETYLSETFGGHERYAHRLALMLDQINLGAQRGSINSTQADRLRARQSELAGLEAGVRSRGFDKVEADDLEKRINVFNVEISQTLSSANQTAGAGLSQ